MANNQAKGKGERLLIIEEDGALRKVMRYMALKMGYQAEVACNVDEALSLFLDGSFNLAVVDFDMAGMNGSDFLKQIKSVSSNTLICLTTAWCEEDISSEMDQLYVDDVLLKPFTFNELREMVGKFLKPKP